MYECVISRAMAQAVSRRPFTSQVRVRGWVSQCKICGRQSGTGIISASVPNKSFIQFSDYYYNIRKSTRIHSPGFHRTELSSRRLPW
jgi:hypothetical protein